MSIQVVSPPPLINSLPNNTRINGIEHFYQSTKPVTRGDGSALVAGDVCYEIGKRHWYFNGLYWLSEPFTIGNVVSTTDMVERVGEDLRGCFLHYIVAKGRVASAPNWNGSNYWQTNFFFGAVNINNLARLDSTSGYVGGGDTHFYRKFDYNTAIIPTYPSGAGSNIFFAQIRSVGSPTAAGSGSSQLSYFYNLSFIWL